MAKRILITGAGGFLGSRLFEYFKDREGVEAIGVTHRELDIVDSLAVSAFIKAIQPNVVLHCAAISNTGHCEENPKLSDTVNVRGTANVAKACRENGSRMVFMSSDQIYTGTDSLEPNREGEEHRPQNVYGKDKKRAENAMLTCMKDGIALRLSWMYDYPTENRVGSSNLLANILKAAKEGASLSFPVNDYRGITYVWEVVKNMEKAMELPGGIYNFGSENRMNAYDTAVMFAGAAAGNGGLIKKDMERFAASPRNLAMNTEKIKRQGILFSDTAEGLKLCLEEYGKNGN